MGLNTLIESFQELEREVEALKPGGEVKDKMQGQRWALLAERLRNLEKELHLAGRTHLIGSLLRAVLHELKNHLGTINTAAYYLSSKIDESGTVRQDPKLVKFIGIIEQEVNNANAILRKISDFARPRQLVLGPLGTEEVIERTFQLLIEWRPLPENIEIIRKINPGLPPLLADSKQLPRAFAEILLNAIEAMPERGRVTLEARSQKSEVRSQRSKDRSQRSEDRRQKTGDRAQKPEDRGQGVIEVCFADTGRGIPEGDIEKLFDPLFTTKIKGYGLGLPISADIIARHNGDLKISSEQGKGTVVLVRLPAAAG